MPVPAPPFGAVRNPKAIQSLGREDGAEGRRADVIGRRAVDDEFADLGTDAVAADDNIGFHGRTITESQSSRLAVFLDADELVIEGNGAGRDALFQNRMKIAAAVKNARAFLAVQEEHGSFDAYCWQFVDGRPRQNRWKAMRQIPATTRESDAFSRDLKRRGFSFVGSTVIYGHMQAVGMVNDHLITCYRHAAVQKTAE